MFEKILETNAADKMGKARNLMCYITKNVMIYAGPKVL
jgi:hypothetical protein